MRESASEQGESPRKTILVADDETSMRELLSMLLETEGYRVLSAANGQDALDTFLREKEAIDLVIQDIKMPVLDGMELLKRLKAERSDVPVVIITAFSTWENAVEAMRLGAFNYVRKPFDTDTIRAVVTRALENKAYVESCRDGDPDDSRGASQLIGNSPLVQEVLRLVKLIAPTDSTVLIQGESGTGKEIVARSIHFRSHRRDKPFIPVNCSAFTESLLESELFGHVRGAFTGAFESKQGLFRAASGGTLFLDEVADMSLTTQVKILRVLEDRKISPVGSTEQHPIDVRIIAATNKGIEEEIRRRTFREDLFYRLNVIPIFLPALRDRKDDIPLLTGHFLAKYSRQMGKNVVRISDNARKMLHDYDWPGNVRELENVIQREVALCEGDTVETLTFRNMAGKVQDDSQNAAASTGEARIPAGGLDLERELERIEREHLKEALERSGGSLMSAAKLLGMSYRSIRYRVKKLKVRESVQ